MTSINNLDDIAKAVADFADERDWDKYHTPKNVATALSIEASELLEHFQWLTAEESANLSPEVLAAVSEEIADVQMYLARLSDKLGINIYQAVEHKMLKNENNYPVDKCYGSAKKYTAYHTKNTSE